MSNRERPCSSNLSAATEPLATCEFSTSPFPRLIQTTNGLISPFWGAAGTRQNFHDHWSRQKLGANNTRIGQISSRPSIIIHTNMILLSPLKFP